MLFHFAAFPRPPTQTITKLLWFQFPNWELGQANNYNLIKPVKIQSVIKNHPLICGLLTIISHFKTAWKASILSFSI